MYLSQTRKYSLRCFLLSISQLYKGKLNKVIMIDKTSRRRKRELFIHRLLFCFLSFSFFFPSRSFTRSICERQQEQI